MMYDYVKITRTRDELANLVNDMSEAIASHWDSLPAPIVITITGDMKSGKSLIWDTIKDSFLKNTAYLDEDVSIGNPSQRLNETWSGKYNNEELKIFFAQACAFTPTSQKLKKTLNIPEINKKHRDYLNNLADIIVVSFTGEEYSSNSNEISTLHLDLQKEDSVEGSWKRRLTVVSAHHALQSTPNFVNIFEDLHVSDQRTESRLISETNGIHFE